MEQTAKKVDWHLYAEKYDMLFDYNPFYQALQKEVLALTENWEIPAGAFIADIGAGTGNYSIFLAKQFPAARVLHIDNNRAMNERANRKKESANLTNLEILNLGIEEVQLKPSSVQAMVSVHALYTFPDPQAALRKMFSWMKSGGIGILIDPGRIVNVMDWQLAIGRRLIAKYGLAKTWEIFREGKPVSEQNRIIRQLQHKGKLWTHSTEEFCQTVAEAGFEILDYRTCFRGLSDMAIITKP